MSSARSARRIAVAVLVVASVVLGATGVAAAQTTRTGGSVVVEQGETVDGIQAFGGTVVVRGTVDGDVSALAGSVVVAETGRVTGDLQATTGNIDVRGTVEGSVEGAAGAVLVGSDAVIGGDLRVAASSLVVEGTVEGGIEAAVDRLTLASTASVNGDVRYAQDGDLVREDGATVGGTVTAVDDMSVDVGFGGDAPDLGPVSLLFTVFGVLVTLLLGAILLLAFPRFADDVAGEVRDEPLRSGGLGLLAFVGIPVVLVAIAITVVGIPLTFLGFMAYGLLVFASAALAEYAVGAWALSLADVENRWAALVVGVLAVAVLSRVPVVGWLVNLVVFLLGFGAVVALLYRGFREYRGGEDETPQAEPAAS
jgi:cytoskeletal protein CcmA (bactofilin family)